MKNKHTVQNAMQRIFTVIMMIITSLLFVPSIQAQTDTPDNNSRENLSLTKAIEIALQNNHNIIIARNTTRIDENSATYGNAGLLPSLTTSGRYQWSIENTNLNFSGNTPAQSTDGSESSQLNLGATLSYTIFDGFGNYYRFKQLESQASVSAAVSRLTIEQTLLRVIQRYLEVVGQQQLVDVNLEAIEISNQRYYRAQRAFELGGQTRVNLLNAEVALNQDSVRYIQSLAQLANAKRNLLLLTGSNPDNKISVSSEVSLNESLRLPALVKTAYQSNASLIASQLRLEQSKYALEQSKSAWYPRLSADASYNYTRSESDANILTFQESNGLTAGISLSFSIFDGFQRSINIQNTRLRIENSKEQKNLAQKSLKRDLYNAFEDYQTNLFLLRKQQVNLETARLNFERTREAYQMGQITNTEYREAQLNVLRTQQEIIRLRIESKASEVNLLQLSGMLMQQIDG